MAYRVTDTEVKKIIDTTITTTPFIRSANLVVTDRLVGQGLSTDMLKEIELWLAAHFVAIRDKQFVKRKIGDAEDTYQVGKLGEGLKATEFGQQVILLDSTGILSRAGKGSASLELIGDY